MSSRSIFNICHDRREHWETIQWVTIVAEVSNKRDPQAGWFCTAQVPGEKNTDKHTVL